MNTKQLAEMIKELRRVKLDEVRVAYGSPNNMSKGDLTSRKEFFHKDMSRDLAGSGMQNRASSQQAGNQSMKYGRYTRDISEDEKEVEVKAGTKGKKKTIINMKPEQDELKGYY